MNTYQLSYTASEIDEKLGKVNSLEDTVKNIRVSPGGAGYEYVSDVSVISCGPLDDSGTFFEDYPGADDIAAFERLVKSKIDRNGYIDSDIVPSETEFTVLVDGVPRTALGRSCIDELGHDAVWVGNGSLAVIGANDYWGTEFGPLQDTGEDFCIVVMDGRASFGGHTESISLVQRSAVIEKIDPKFLPDTSSSGGSSSGDSSSGGTTAPMVECPKCEGVGRVCSECGHTVDPDVHVCTNSSCGGGSTASCPLCDGSGKVPKTTMDAINGALDTVISELQNSGRIGYTERHWITGEEIIHPIDPKFIPNTGGFPVVTLSSPFDFTASGEIIRNYQPGDEDHIEDRNALVSAVPLRTPFILQCNAAVEWGSEAFNILMSNAFNESFNTLSCVGIAYSQFCGRKWVEVNVNPAGDSATIKFIPM